MNDFYISFFGINKLPVNIWGKLYRKEFIDNIPDPPLTGLILEDLAYNMHTFPYIKTMVLIPDNVYCYRWGGYTNHFDNTILETGLYGYRMKQEAIIENNKNEFIPYISVELLNYVKSYIVKCIQYKMMNEESVKKFVNEIFLKDEVVQCLENIKEYDGWRNSYRIMLEEKDYLGIYEHCVKEANHEKKRMLVLKILTKLLNQCAKNLLVSAD